MNGKAIHAMVLKHFDGDARKTAWWFRTASEFMGGLAPRDYIRLKRTEMLGRIVKSAIDGNIP